MSTGISHSQTLKLLSSEVVTNLRFSSTNVIVFTAPKCLSYSCVISPERISHCKIYVYNILSDKIEIYIIYIYHIIYPKNKNTCVYITHADNFFVAGTCYK